MRRGYDKIVKCMTGKQWIQLTKPCIYFWYRQERCLYIGQSRNGIIRPCGSHHVINMLEFVLPSDELKVIWLPVGSPPDALDFLEQNYIRKLRPFYNTIRYEKTTTTKNVPKLPSRIRAKEKLAEVLFPVVPERLLLVNPQNSSDDDLRDRIEFLEKQQLKLKALKRLQAETKQ